MRRTDDLQYRGLVLVQDTELPCFSEDSVLLANYLKARPSDSVVDIGCGNGILSVLGQGKTGARFTGFDISAEQIALAEDSCRLNGQEIAFHVLDAADAASALGAGRFDAAVCNPPYFTAADAGPDPARAAARHLDAEGLSPFLRAAFLLLKNGGSLYLCYPASGLAEVLCALRGNRMEAKELQLVAASAGKDPRLALIRAKKGAAPGMTVFRTRTPEEIIRQETEDAG